MTVLTEHIRNIAGKIALGIDVGSTTAKIAVVKNGEIIRQTYENALAAGDKNVYFIDGSKIYEGFDDATVEGCHANDLGFWLQAGAVEKVLKKLL